MPIKRRVTRLTSVEAHWRPSPPPEPGTVIAVVTFGLRFGASGFAAPAPLAGRYGTMASHHLIDAGTAASIGHTRVGATSSTAATIATSSATRRRPPASPR